MSEASLPRHYQPNALPFSTVMARSGANGWCRSHYLMLGLAEMLRASKAFRIACCLAFVSLPASGAIAQQIGKPNVIAIDVLLEADAAMVDRAKALNGRLRQNYPQGFALGGAHAPHITLIQRFVRASDLNAVTGAVSKAAQSGPALPIKLTASGFISTVWGGIGLVVYEVERSPELAMFANNMVEAMRPFAVSGGGGDAFAKAPGEEINIDTIRYVEAFVPASTGDRYRPHVTVGNAYPDFIAALKAEPFEKFNFSGINIAIYQLGNFGTAQRVLWSWRSQ